MDRDPGLAPLRPRLLTQHQAAAYLGRSVSALKALSVDADPQIGAIRLTPRGDRLYPVELLDAYIDRCIAEQVPRHLLPLAA